MVGHKIRSAVILLVRVGLDFDTSLPPERKKHSPETMLSTSLPFFDFPGCDEHHVVGMFCC